MKRITLRLLCLFSILFCCASSWAYDAEIDGVYYNLSDGEATVTYCSQKYMGDVVIPEKVTHNGTTYAVTSIGMGAFDQCSGLTSVIIPNSVTSIGMLAFSCCADLTFVTIPNSVKSMGHSVFSYCTGLTSVTISEAMTSIDNYTFLDCAGLTSVTIPEGVTSIGKEAFSGCSGLTSVTIPDNVKSIGGYAFYGCLDLVSVTIPSSVTSIGGGAFFGCKSLEQAGVGEGVTTIPARCFGNCKKLVSIALGSNVSSIGNNAFENCPLEEIYAYPLEAPTSGSCVFTIEKPKVKVYVTNKEAYDKYKASSEWCDFNLQLMSEDMLVGDVTAEGTAVKLFTLNGQRATCNQKGIVVKNGKKYLQK